MPQLSIPILISFAFVVIGFCLLYKNKTGFAVFSLFLAAIVLRLWAAHLDPFLHDWDERFHALVARNMMEDPFKPMLRKTPISNEVVMDWCCSHIWLHKQPLFLWQMALSMKIFGVSEFAIRYPAVLQGALLVPMVYRIAWYLVKNKFVSFIAALLMCFSAYNLELIAGIYNVDQNDAVFVFYVTASIWAYVEYMNSSRKMKWAIIIGLFAGGAILTKWLTGLLVYSAWGISVLGVIYKKEGYNEMKHYLVSLLTCSIVFIPWQLYIWKAFPVEARYEYEYNLRHLTENLEETQSSYSYYLDHLDVYFGKNLWVALIIGIVLLLVKYRNRLSLSLIFYFFLVFIFFSLVKSQMEAFVYIVAPVGFVFIASSAILMLKNRYLRYALAVLVVIGVGNVFNYDAIAKKHDPDDEQRQVKIHNEAIYKSLQHNLPQQYKLVLNAKQFGDVNVMFYNYELDVYSWCLNDHLIDSLISKKVPIAAFSTRYGYGVNDKLLHYSHFFQINGEIK